MVIFDSSQIRKPSMPPVLIRPNTQEHMSRDTITRSLCVMLPVAHLWFMRDWLVRP